MLLPDPHAPGSRKRLVPEQEAGTAVALLFIILPKRRTGLGRKARTRTAMKLLACFVKADNRILRVIRALVDIEDVFHFAHVLGAGFADTPCLDAPGLNFIFFMV